MKEIVQMTSQKMEIKKAQRLQVAKDKESRTKSVLEDLKNMDEGPDFKMVRDKNNKSVQNKLDLWFL